MLLTHLPDIFRAFAEMLTAADFQYWVPAATAAQCWRSRGRAVSQMLSLTG